MTELLPAGVSPFIALLLIVVSFFTSALTAAFGLGGGVAMLGALAQTVNPGVVVAVHAIVQFGSNVGRAFVQRAHVLWPVAIRFALGSIVGVLIGAYAFIAIPERLFLAILGLFILTMAWIPKPNIPGLDKAGVVLGGAISAVATMFVGATGPLTNAILKAIGADKKQIVATQAMCMTVQHTLKALAFGFIGFSFREWIWLVLAMIASGLAGTMLGTKLLDRMSEETFSFILKWMLTIIALDLIRRAVGIALPI
jgi:uncharacterized membrane protein YfcA